MTDGFNALKDDFTKFLNSSSNAIMNETNKNITNYSNSLQLSVRSSLTKEFDKTVNSINNNTNLIKNELTIFQKRDKMNLIQSEIQ